MLLKFPDVLHPSRLLYLLCLSLPINTYMVYIYIHIYTCKIQFWNIGRTEEKCRPQVLRLCAKKQSTRGTTCDMEIWNNVLKIVCVEVIKENILHSSMFHFNLLFTLEKEKFSYSSICA